MMLSDHFSLEEMTVSQIAIRAQRIVEAPQFVIDNLVRLCWTVLEPIRQDLAQPIVISSGYRPDWLNAMIGGSKKSQHMIGCAADIYVSGMTPLELAMRVRGLKIRELDQCILEFPPAGWVHVSVADVSATPRNKFLTARIAEHKVVYSVGLSDRV